MQLRVICKWAEAGHGIAGPIRAEDVRAAFDGGCAALGRAGQAGSAFRSRRNALKAASVGSET